MSRRQEVITRIGGVQAVSMNDGEVWLFAEYNPRTRDVDFYIQSNTIGTRSITLDDAVCCEGWLMGVPGRQKPRDFVEQYLRPEVIFQVGHEDRYEGMYFSRYFNDYTKAVTYLNSLGDDELAPPTLRVLVLED